MSKNFALVWFFMLACLLASLGHWGMLGGFVGGYLGHMLSTYISTKKVVWGY